MNEPSVPPPSGGGRDGVSCASERDDHELRFTIASEERREALRIAWHRAFMLWIFAGSIMAYIAMLAIFSLALLVVWTVVAHTLLPQSGWLTHEQQMRLTGWFSTPVPWSLLTVIGNSWALWFLSRNRDR